MKNKTTSPWSDELKKSGYKLTAPREAIMRTLFESNAHLSADDIFMHVRETCPGTGLTTVYRTLEILHDIGIVQKFDFDHGKARYELAERFSNGKKHHHHLVCRKCESVIDYSDFSEEEIDFLRKIERVLEKKYDFGIESHEIQFYGTCGACTAGDKLPPGRSTRSNNSKG
jgi:Fur family ferric uptake transcriptional regulator